MNPRPMLLLCLCLAACVTAPQAAPPDVAKTGYGAFVGLGPQWEERLAEEAARQLEHAHPPPRSLLLFEQRIHDEDGFGQRLLRALSRDGYFVRQWYDPAMPPQCGEPSGAGKSGETFRIVPACYVLDSVHDMLRLTLYLAGEVWSRFYTIEQTQLRPLGAWTLHKKP